LNVLCLPNVVALIDIAGIIDVVMLKYYDIAAITRLHLSGY